MVSLWNQVGLNEQEILAKGNCTKGIVMDVKTLWLLKVNTKPVRKGTMDGATFPHRVTFRYAVDGMDYTGSKVLPPSVSAPACGEQITVFYDPDAPERCALSIGM